MRHVIGNKVIGNKKLSKSNKGFTLIEVLIGIFIAAVGIVGVLEIQKHVIRSGNEVNARTIAIQLVREKLDVINNIDFFTDVGTAPIPAVENNILKNNYSFTRNWAMTAHHFDEDAATWGVVGTGESTDAKHVTVSVTWTDINNEEQTVNGEQIIARSSIHDTSGLSTTSGDRIKPDIPYSSLSSTENPPITLIDDTMDTTGVTVNTKETSKPIPTVSGHNNSNLIQFETVVYDPNSDTQTLEDFATVNCSCSFNSTTDDGATPSLLRLSDDESTLVNDETSGRGIHGDLGVTKVTGVSNDNQAPKLCDKCCADHHDVGDATSIPKYVTGTTSGNHPHYNASLTTAVTSGDYIEACRFRRIDGFYQLVPDWYLVDIITMPISFFNSTTNRTAYTSYVKSVVKLCVQNIDDCYSNTLTLPAKPEARDLTGIVPGSQQLISRGIYVDTASLKSSDLSTIIGYVDTKANWLEYVPFYEVNLTLFSDWASSNTNSVTVTTEAINTISDASQGYYGTYSRGRITAQPLSGTSVVTATNNVDNTGITGSGQIKSDSLGNYALNGTLNVTVNGTPATGTNSLLIEIDCQKYNNQNVLTGCSGQDTANVITILDPSTITCSYYPQQGNNTAFFTCNAVPDWQGSINFTSSGFTFGEMTCGVDDTLTTEFNLVDSTTEICSIVMTENTP